MTAFRRLPRGALPILAALAAATVIALPANAAGFPPPPTFPGFGFPQQPFPQPTVSRSAQPSASPAPSPRPTATATAVPAPARAAEWWLTALRLPQAWQAAPGQGAGVTVAVLSTGVDAAHPDLTGDVTTGPDYTGSGRSEGSGFWGAEGTAVASLIAGHGHGTGGKEGITGVAPRARILSVRVTLEYNDPLNADTAIGRRLPGAIAAGIRYAVSHGARVIALPLDPGTLGPAMTGDPAAAGGSGAERAAVSYALARGVVLIAPAGDNGAATGNTNYPAAYPGVVAVGATEQSGQLAPFTSTRPYVALTAPGAGLTMAAPGGGYSTLASTDMSAALTAGVAALIRARYPRLDAAQVTQALQRGSSRAPQEVPGTGHGMLNAAAAMTEAADIARTEPAETAHPAAPASGGPHARPRAADAGPGMLARAALMMAVAAAALLIVALAVALVLARRRRARARAAARREAAARRGAAARTRAGPRYAPPRSHSTRERRMAPGPAANGRRPGPRGQAWAANRPGAAGNPARGRTAPFANGRIAPAGNPGMPMAGRQRARQDPGAPRTPRDRPPWEQFGEFAAAPVPADFADPPIAKPSPMYVWNPAATTGPLPALGPPGPRDLPDEFEA